MFLKIQQHFQKKTQEKSIRELQYDSLIPESDVKVLQSSGTGFLTAIILCLVASSIHYDLPQILFKRDATHEALVNVVIETPKKPEPVAKKDQRRQAKPGKKGSTKKTNRKLTPQAKKEIFQSVGILHRLTSRTSGPKDAYELFDNKSMHKELDKALKVTDVLRTHGKTEITARRGKVQTGEGLTYGKNGDGTNCGIDCLLGDILDRGPTGISTKARKTKVKLTQRNIDMAGDFSGRSKASIMKVIRARTPGLRNLYNKALRVHPGFSGKVTLRFTILPSGKVVRAVVSSSTTKIPEFDQKIRVRVLRWKFGKVKSGSVTITVPFTFSE